MLEYQARVDLYDKDALDYSVAPIDNTEKIKEYFVAPSAKIEKQLKNIPRHRR